MSQLISEVKKSSHSTSLISLGIKRWCRESLDFITIIVLST